MMKRMDVNRLLLDQLAVAIIEAAADSSRDDAPHTPSIILVNKIRGRIQEIREQRSGSCEVAIESMLGWLAAFAAAAIILIAASIQWQPPAGTGDFESYGDELTIQNPAAYFISSVPSKTGKDTSYACK